MTDIDSTEDSSSHHTTHPPKLLRKRQQAPISSTSNSNMKELQDLEKQQQSQQSQQQHVKSSQQKLKLTQFSKKHHYACPCGFGGFHLMGDAPSNDTFTYQPSRVEEMANTLTHFIPALLSILLMSHMIHGSRVANTAREILSTYIYVGCCTILFLISALYHFSSFCFGYSSRITQFCRKMDYSIIFAFIASSYTPWLLCLDVGVDNMVGRIGVGIVWIIALFGVVKHLTNMFPNQNVLLLYLFMGWISVFYMGIVFYQMFAGYLVTQLDLMWTLVWIIGGGAVYSCGTLLWRLDGILPFAHAFWHVAVVVAAAMHVYAVNRYLMILE